LKAQLAVGKSKVTLHKAKINEIRIRVALPHFHFPLYSMIGKKIQQRKIQPGCLPSVPRTEPGTSRVYPELPAI
jgi:hypothetical protein